MVDTTTSSAPQTKAEYIGQVERELASAAHFDGSQYRDTKEEILIETVLFGAWAQEINRATNYELTASEKAKVARLKEEVSDIQRREFPRMRAAWGKILAQAMWEHNMTVSTGGEGNRTLRLTAAIFASNGNIKKINGVVWEQATLLRFKRIEYRWYKGEEEYTYFRVDSPKDSAVRRISGNGYEPAD